MTGLLLRALIYVAIAGAIYFGIRSILRDWQRGFREIDRKTRERDLRERKRMDIVHLQRDKDGVYRPGPPSGSDKEPRA